MTNVLGIDVILFLMIENLLSVFVTTDNRQLRKIANQEWSEF